MALGPELEVATGVVEPLIHLADQHGFRADRLEGLRVEDHFRDLDVFPAVSGAGDGGGAEQEETPIDVESRVQGDGQQSFVGPDHRGRR